MIQIYNESNWDDIKDIQSLRLTVLCQVNHQPILLRNLFLKLKVIHHLLLTMAWKIIKP